MAIPLRLQLLVLFLLLLLISLFISAATATPSLSPSLPSSTIHTYPPTLFATILSSLGFQDLSTAAASSNLSATTPLTLFAPSDSSLLTCPSCSHSLLLHELSLPALYPFHFLQSLPFGTKIESLSPNRCLTITTTSSTNTNTDHSKANKVFVNGVEISHPDLFNNGFIIIHGLSGYVTHLSPLSCNVERMTSLSFPPSSSSSSSSNIMRLMLKDAIIRLRTTGYVVVSLALRVKYVELLQLKSFTVFALDDVSIFSGEGNAYLSNFRYHVVPNRRLTAAELVSLPSTTSLQTMYVGNSLVVTSAGGGGPLAPMKINYVKITTIDLLHNTRIAIHGISAPFPHMHHQFQPLDDEKESGFGSAIQRSKCDHFDWHRGICVLEAEVPAGVQSTVEAQDHHTGL